MVILVGHLLILLVSSLTSLGAHVTGEVPYGTTPENFIDNTTRLTLSNSTDDQIPTTLQSTDEDDLGVSSDNSSEPVDTSTVHPQLEDCQGLDGQSSEMNSSRILSGYNKTSLTNSDITSSPFEGGVLGKATFEKTVFIISCIGICSSGLGSAWNTIAVIVYSRMPKSPTNTYLMGLTVLDILYLVCTLTPFSMLIALEGNVLANSFFLHYAIYVSSGIMPCLRKTIICVTMMLSLERLMAIAFPFKARHFRIIRNPGIFIFGFFVMVLAVNVCNFFKLTIIDIYNPTINKTVPSIQRTTFGNNNSQFFEIINYISSGLFVYVPLVIIIVANIWLVVALQTHTSRRTTLPRTDDSPSQFYVLERQKAILIITYTLLFVLLTLPFSLHVVFCSLIPGFAMGKKQQYLFLIMQRIYGLLDVFSSSMNFLVYVVMSSSFRQKLGVLLGFKRKKVNLVKPPKSVTGSTDSCQI